MQKQLNFRLFRHFQGIIDFNTQIPHCTFQFCVPQEQLYRPQVLCPSVYQRSLCAPEGVCAIIGRVKADAGDPFFNDSGILPGGDMGRAVDSAGEQEILALDLDLLDPVHD